MTEHEVDLVNDLEFDDYRYANYKILSFSDLFTSAIKISQDFKLGKGGILWDASYVMSRFLNTLDLQGKKVLELGSGTALPSILSALKGAEADATDIFPALSLTLANSELNQTNFTGKVNVAELDWTNSAHRHNIPHRSYDIIILSDVFYLPVSFKQDLAQSFIETLLYFSSPHTQILMTYKYRISEILDPYLDLLKKNFEIQYFDDFVSTFYHNPQVHLGICTFPKLNN